MATAGVIAYLLSRPVRCRELQGVKSSRFLFKETGIFANAFGEGAVFLWAWASSDLLIYTRLMLFGLLTSLSARSDESQHLLSARITTIDRRAILWRTSLP